MLGRLVTILLFAQLGLVVWNLRVVRRPATRHWGHGAPLISVLVPARDEETTISPCIRALLAQDYPNLEIVVLDDASSDGTVAALAKFRDARLRVVSGARLPAGWTGKNWACHQLVLQANGDVLCFVDADTFLSTETL